MSVRVRRLAADIEWAKSEGRRAGPGWFAQLGVLHARSGQAESAALEFAAERELYPESAVFVDHLAPANSPRVPDPAAHAALAALAAHAADRPRSILVLPPIAGKFGANAADDWLATVTRPLAERGYYVFPVAIVDAMLKADGCSTPEAMHRAPLRRFGELFGADAVLYAEIEHWGTRYHDLESDSQVTVAARLVDVESGAEIWRGTSTAMLTSSEGERIGFFERLVAPVGPPSTPMPLDPSPGLARQANWSLFHSSEGLPLGPHHPKFEAVAATSP